MSNDRRPDQGASPQAQPRDRQPIPVRTLYLPRPTDLPGKVGATALTASSQENKGRHTIDFRPWLRCYCVTFTPPSGEPESRMIPESWASWRPLD